MKVHNVKWVKSFTIYVIYILSKSSTYINFLEHFLEKFIVIILLASINKIFLTKSNKMSVELIDEINTFPIEIKIDQQVIEEVIEEEIKIEQKIIEEEIKVIEENKIEPEWKQWVWT